MRFRKLRIAWSVFWSVACILLIALWVRSYSWNDITTRWDARGFTSFGSNSGDLYLFRINDEGYRNRGWNFGSVRLRPSNPEVYVRAPVEPNTVLVLENAAYDIKLFRNVFGFSAYRTARTTFYKCPVWFAILTIATLAITAWIPLSRRFSLRTLLIAMTLVAVVLGLIVWAGK
jgi:hypothetical protein